MKEVLTANQVTMESNVPKHQKRDNSEALLRDAYEDFQRNLKAQGKYPNLYIKHQELNSPYF